MRALERILRLALNSAHVLAGHERAGSPESRDRRVGREIGLKGWRALYGFREL